MKKTIMKGMAVCLSTVFLAGFAACGGEKAKAKGVSYVGIDVNPSISLVLDENNVVLSVTADNEDAQVLLYGEQLVGLSVEKAVETIAELSVELEYLNDGNHGVSIVAEGKIDGAKLQNAVKTAFEEATAESTFDVSFTADGLFSLQRELDYVNDTYNLNLTVGEYRLIAEAQAADKSLTVQAAANLSTEELLKVIDEKAEAVEPYATKAYNAAKAAALYAYENGKASLIDKLWLTPYINILKYKVNNAAIYNLYSDAARALTVGLDAAEKAAEIKKATSIPKTTVEEIATALGLSADETASFVAAVTVDGKITLESIDGYLDVYFKNMTADEREAAKAQFEAVSAKVQAVASDIKEQMNAAYGEEIEKVLETVNGLIPEELKVVAGVYLNEFTNTLNAVKQNAEGKEPMAAAYAARDTFKEKAAQTYEKMRAELEEGGDLEQVEGMIANVSSSLTKLEEQFNTALAQAETQAKEYLANLKASRKSA
ncbi:MAG: hypothetical protein IJB97_08580 [Clostridia bacterium]|nr:hypothetical protein [Clostridia bacterium]